MSPRALRLVVVAVVLVSLSCHNGKGTEAPSTEFFSPDSLEGRIQAYLPADVALDSNWIERSTVIVFGYYLKSEVCPHPSVEAWYSSDQLVVKEVLLGDVQVADLYLEIPQPPPFVVQEGFELREGGGYMLFLAPDDDTRAQLADPETIWDLCGHPGQKIDRDEVVALIALEGHDFEVVLPPSQDPTEALQTVLAGLAALTDSRVQLTIDGDMEELTVLAAIGENMVKIDACQIEGTKKKPDLQGRVDLVVLINSDGQVTVAKVEKSTLGHEPTSECVAEVFRRMVFVVPPDGAVVQVNMSVEFPPLDPDPGDAPPEPGLLAPTVSSEDPP